ncbi:hypothetical protein [Opitutus sp. ER46]|uniref:hypothetical protein n=1 Tax=Opitutus sp. ER46 TaxID=2161864 RepID=UPI000D317C07|nr:hypothetical protein [Opitutus sp. ER46]PTX91432.1 hypothetical protein DB354_16205 [Opitutus sp. ER46]
MLSALVRLFTGSSSPDTECAAFVEEVRTRERERRNPRVERLILICWLLIALKHVAVIWCVHHYPVPFDALWVNLPTWLLGTLATVTYYGRVR